MGIPLASNFDIGSPIPIDSRSVVADLTARDAIAAGRRFIGMSVFVLSDSNNYQLVGGILDADWQEFAGAGGGGAYPVGFTDDFDSTDVLLNPLSSHVRINGDGVDAPIIWGMVAAPEAQTITVMNVSGNWATFAHEAATVPEDSFYIPDGFILEDLQFVTFAYDGTLQRWVIQSFSQNSRIQGNLLRMGSGSGDVMIEAVTGGDPFGAPPYISYDTFSSKWSYNNGNGAVTTPMVAGDEYVAKTGATMSGNLAVHSGTTTSTLGINNLYITDSAYPDSVAYYGQENSYLTSKVGDVNYIVDTYPTRIEIRSEDVVTFYNSNTIASPGQIFLSVPDGLGGSMAPLAVNPGDLTTKRYVDGKVSKTGDVMSGTLSVSVPATGTSNIGWQGISAQSADSTQSVDCTLDYMSIYLNDPGLFNSSTVITPSHISLVFSDIGSGTTYSTEMQDARITLSTSDGATTYPTIPILPEEVTTKAYVDQSVGNVTVNTYSTETTLTNANGIVLVSGNTNIRLMTAATARKKFTVKNIGTGIINIIPNGAETIDGAISFVLNDQYSSIAFVSNGTSWSII